MKKSIYLLSLLLSLFISCEKSDGAADDLSTRKSKIEINTNIEELSKRLDYSNSGVISIVNSPSANRMEGPRVTNFPLVQIAEVNPPKDNNGRTLQADHVTVNGNYVYVAYTMIGEAYSGAIDVVDVSDPYKPKLITSALIADTDITSLTYSGGRLIIAGAVSIDQTPGLTNPSIVINMQLNAGLFTQDYVINQLEGQVTTDVTANATSYFAVTGDTGSLYKMDNNSKQITDKTALEDLRSLGINDNKIVTLSGTKGINIYDEANLSLQKSFATSTDVSGAKRTIDFDEQKILVSEGYNGLGVYDMNSGSKLQTIPVTNSGGDNATNAVSVNEGHAFVANGAAGSNVYETGSQLDLVGTIEVEGSSNYVKSSGDFIYVASGKGGLKIIKMERHDSNSLSCEQYPVYNEGSDLIVNANETKSFTGSTAINSIIINSGASLNHCGSITVQNNLIINNGGTFNMRGTLAQGKYQQPDPTELIVNENGLLQIEGTVVIWGDVRLNNGANVNFVGDDSSITIYGTVTKGNNVSITGNYKDTEQKLQ